jgi:hypothetical protein
MAGRCAAGDEVGFLASYREARCRRRGHHVCGIQSWELGNVGGCVVVRAGHPYIGVTFML